MKIAQILALIPAGSAPIEVIGDGALAEELRKRLEDRGLTPSCNRPLAIIDTIGEEAVLVASLKRVDDLGTIILAGSTPPEPVTLDLYSDLHVRGLTIVGVP
jgi:hypothetical protein